MVIRSGLRNISKHKKIKQHSLIFTEPIYFNKLTLPPFKLSSNVARQEWILGTKQLVLKTWHPHNQCSGGFALDQHWWDPRHSATISGWVSQVCSWRASCSLFLSEENAVSILWRWSVTTQAKPQWYWGGRRGPQKQTSDPNVNN